MNYAFENFVFDVRRCELFRDGVLVPLEPQVCRVLHILLENAGETVSRDKLFEEVWGGRSVSASVIDNRIRAARRAIEDDGRTQRLIKTFVNEGYKFVGSVEVVSPDPAEDVPGVTASANQTSGPPSGFRLRRNLSLIAGGALLTSVIALMLISLNTFGFERNEPRAAQQVQPSPSESAAPSDMTLAVLPFTVAGRDPDVDYRELEFAQSFIDVMSTVPDIGIVSSLSSFRFKDASIPIEEIAETLKVENIISGTVSLVDDQFVIVTRMIEARTGIVQWTKTYRILQDLKPHDRERSTRAAVLNLLNSLGITSNLPSEHLISTEAHEDYERARMLLLSQDPGSINDAIARLEKVVASEHDFVPAHTEVIYAYHLATELAGVTTEDAARAIDRHAMHAEAVSANSPDVLVALGLQARYHNKLPVELEFYNRALRLAPNNPRAIVLRAEVLRRMGDFEASGKAYKQALALNPLSTSLLSRVARTEFEKGAVREAFNYARENLRWNSRDIEALIDLALFSRETGEYAQAFFLLKDALAIAPENSDAQFQMLLLLRSIGQIETFEKFITSPSYLVLGHTLSGNEEAARASLRDDPLSQFSGFFSYVFGDSAPLYEYLNGSGLYSEFKVPSARISTQFVFDAVFYADVNKSNSDPSTDFIISNILDYFRERSLSTLQLEEEHLALAGIEALRQNHDAVLRTIRHATDRKFLFVGSLQRSPVFRDMRDKPEFQALISEMQEEADMLWSSITAQQKGKTGPCVLD